MESRGSPTSYKLTAEEKQFFFDNGYLVVRGLIDKGTCDNLRQRFRQIVQKEVPRDMVAVIEDVAIKQKTSNPEDYVNKINTVHHDPEFMKYTENPRLLDVISQLMADRLMVMHSMLINKPPGSVWHPPHQDIYPLPLRPVEKVLTAWTAIDEATQDNGCLFVIPGSHKTNIIYEEHELPGFINNLFYFIKDHEAVAPKDKWVALPMKPGDAVLMTSMLVHASFPNVSKRHRKSISCVYAAADCEFIDVSDTIQGPFMAALLVDLKKRGYNTENYNDLWKYRLKDIQKSKI